MEGGERPREQGCKNNRLEEITPFDDIWPDSL